MLIPVRVSGMLHPSWEGADAAFAVLDRVGPRFRCCDQRSGDRFGGFGIELDRAVHFYGFSRGYGRLDAGMGCVDGHV